MKQKPAAMNELLPEYPAGLEHEPVVFTHWLARLLWAGDSRNNVRWHADVVEAAAGAFEGAMVRRNEQLDHAFPSEWNARQMAQFFVGRVIKAWARNGTAFGIIEVTPWASEFQQSLVDAWQQHGRAMRFGRLSGLGLSLYSTSPGNVIAESLRTDGTREVWQVGRPVKFDVTDRPATDSGFIRPLTEQEVAIMTATVESAKNSTADLSPVDAARQAVHDAFSVELELDERRERLVADLPELEAAAGRSIRASLKDTGDARDAVLRLSETRAEADALDSAVAAVRAERIAAIWSLREAEAEDRKARVVELRQEADAHYERTSELLEALEAHEGTAYEPARLRLAALSSMGVYVEHNGSPELPPMSRTAALRKEADDLEIQLAATSKPRLNDRGSTTRLSLDELLDTVVEDAFKIAPARSTVRAWFEDQDIVKRYRTEHGKLPGKGTFEIAVSWERGELVPGRSIVKPAGR